jgi:hypothetical protein
MKITVEYLKKINACPESVEAYKEHGKEYELIPLIRKMIREKYQLDWASWLIVRCMTYKQYVSYAVYAAEQVIDIYEKEHPDDDRPRKAIEAAKKCIDDPSYKNRDAARAAAEAAQDAAWAAAWAAEAAARAAAEAAQDAAWVAARNAAWAAAKEKMQIKILRYGIKLLKEEGAKND